MANDPRPKNYKEIVGKFRKVIPPDLAVKPAASQRFTSRQRSVTTGLEIYSDSWDNQAILHLLKRTLFGVTKSELDAFSSKSMEETISSIIRESPAIAPPTNNYNGVDNVTDPHISFGSTLENAPFDDEHESYRIISLKGWLINSILQQPTTIHEKMVYFWHNLLVIQTWDVFIAKANYNYFSMLRRNALGNYKTLIKELTLDPAMLLYLNGTRNNKYAPDENYGRELQELFCIGKGPGSQYTESDVQAAARVLTGWVIDWNSVITSGKPTSSFYADWHDTTNKQFSSFYNNRVIAGKTGASGASELDELLDMIFDNPETSLYICRRLYSFFVSSEIDSSTEANVIAPLAEIFRSNDFEILPVLNALFRSAHFFDEANRGVLIKSPADHVLGMWRALGMTLPNTEPNIQYIAHASILWHMASIGQELGDPPSVAGWPAYYQAPQYDKAWITTDTITTRAITTDSMLFWGFWISESLQLKANVIAFVSGLNNPGDPNALIEDVVNLFLGIGVSATVKSELKSILLSGQLSDYYWTNAWNDYVLSPDNDTYKQIVLTRLQLMLQRLLQLGEYQLM